MELWTSLRVLLRRWYVVLPCLAVTAFVALQLAGQVKPTYKAEGTVVFLRPLQAQESATVSNNPWQTVDYSLNQFALLMGQAAASDAFRDRVSAAGGSTAFSVTTSANQAQGSPTNQTPTLTLSVIADTPESAMASYEVLGAALDQEVKDRQRSVGAAESTWITAVDLTVPPGAVELVGSRITVLIAVALAGTLVSLGLVFALDALLTARHHRHEVAAPIEATGDPPGDEPEDPAPDDDREDEPAVERIAGGAGGPVRLAPAPASAPGPTPAPAVFAREAPEARTGERRDPSDEHDGRGVRRAFVDVDDLALDDLTLDDLIEDWPDEGDGVDEAVGQ